MDADTDELVDALASEDAREILCLANREPMSAQNLQEEVGVSVATVYRHTDDLIDANLLREETEITDDGDHYSTYETRVRSVTLTVDGERIRVDVTVRDDLVDRFSRAWRSLGESRSG